MSKVSRAGINQSRQLGGKISERIQSFVGG